MNYPFLILFSVLALQVGVPATCGRGEGSMRADSPADTAPDIIYEVPMIDGEFSQSAESKLRCAECSGSAYPFESEKVRWFREVVYDSAMKNPDLPIENKKFLDALLAYVISDTLEEYYQLPPDHLIRPVYNYRDTVRIFSDFKEHFDGYAVYNLDLTSKEKNAQYYLFRSNSTLVRSCKIRDEIMFRTECSSCRSNQLYISSASDTLQPAFCSPFNLQMEWKQDTVFDKLLYNVNQCEDICHWFCGACNVQCSFAQLKGVPGLWFTTDAPDDDPGPYPTRAIFINVNNQYAMELWRYELDLSSCGCI